MKPPIQWKIPTNLSQTLAEVFGKDQISEIIYFVVHIHNFKIYNYGQKLVYKLKLVILYLSLLLSLLGLGCISPANFRSAKKYQLYGIGIGILSNYLLIVDGGYCA